MAWGPKTTDMQEHNQDTTQGDISDLLLHSMCETYFPSSTFLSFLNTVSHFSASYYQ